MLEICMRSRGHGNGASVPARRECSASLVRRTKFLSGSSSNSIGSLMHMKVNPRLILELHYFILCGEPDWLAIVIHRDFLRNRRLVAHNEFNPIRTIKGAKCQLESCNEIIWFSRERRQQDRAGVRLVNVVPFVRVNGFDRVNNSRFVPRR